MFRNRKLFQKRFSEQVVKVALTIGLLRGPGNFSGASLGVEIKCMDHRLLQWPEESRYLSQLNPTRWLSSWNSRKHRWMNKEYFLNNNHEITNNSFGTFLVSVTNASQSASGATCTVSAVYFIRKYGTAVVPLFMHNSSYACCRAAIWQNGTINNNYYVSERCLGACHSGCRQIFQFRVEKTGGLR